MAKSPKDHIHKAKVFSFFASIFTLSIFIPVFYIFNLSPSTLFNNNIFWFFMFNTLILIIAADYGAFSSSSKDQKQDLDLYQEYEKHIHTRKYVQVDENCGNPKQENIETITEKSEIPERVLEVVVQNDPKKPKKLELDDFLREDDKAGDEETKTLPAARSYWRSKSDICDRRLESMKVEAREEEEENEFSAMTNEELNIKVEEFIQRFNRQIRLQKARNVYQI